MLNLQLQLRPQTEKRLKKILNLYKDQEVFAQNIIDFQISELKRGIVNIRLDMEEHEKRYQMSSKEFYKNFKNGELDDTEDFMAWAGIYELFEENTNKLKKFE